MPAPSPTPSSIDVTTYHYDNLRTGQNLNEITLTTANVNQTKFRKLGELMVDGKVDAQPLYLSNVSMPSVGAKNVLYVATEHGSVFAFDADNVRGATAPPLWRISTQLPGEGPSDDRGCGQVTPEIGITSTPVIDRARGAIYVVSVSKDGSGHYFHRMHALDLTSGKELFGGPTTITATYPGNGAAARVAMWFSTPPNTTSGQACWKSTERSTQRGGPIAILAPTLPG
jgi:outer membrane protein assembly factor BamB